MVHYHSDPTPPPHTDMHFLSSCATSDAILPSPLPSPLQVKQQQSEIFQYLDSKKIMYKPLDITQDSSIKDEMRSRVGNPTAMPPQVFNGDTYCGVSESSLTPNLTTRLLLMGTIWSKLRLCYGWVQL